MKFIKKLVPTLSFSFVDMTVLIFGECLVLDFYIFLLFYSHSKHGFGVVFVHSLLIYVSCIAGNGFPQPVPKEVAMEMYAQCNDKTSKSDDEE